MLYPFHFLPLMKSHILASPLRLAVLYSALVRSGVAPENETQPIPIQPVTDRARERTDRRKRSDLAPILLVNRSANLLVVEFVSDEAAATREEIVERMAVSPDEAWDVPGGTICWTLNRRHCTMIAVIGNLAGLPWK